MSEKPQAAAAALVISRMMYEYDVDFRLQDARIYGQTPKTVDQTVVSNPTAEAKPSPINFNYVERKAMIWQSSASSTSPVKATITSAVPLYQLGRSSCDWFGSVWASVPWAESYEATQESTVNFTVTVGPHSAVTVTEGIFDVPFAYTQRDTLSNVREWTTGSSPANLHN